MVAEDHDREVALQVLRSLRQIIRKVSEHSKHLARDVGLTLPQLLCLRVVGRETLDRPEGSLNVVRLAQLVQLSPATVSRIIDRMERAGLVERSRVLRDRRQVRITLTETGAARYQTLPIGLQERFLERLSRLPEDEQQSLVRALRSITDMMEATDLDAAPILVTDSEVSAGDGVKDP